MAGGNFKQSLELAKQVVQQHVLAAQKVGEQQAVDGLKHVLKCLDLLLAGNADAALREWELGRQGALGWKKDFLKTMTMLKAMVPFKPSSKKE